MAKFIEKKSALNVIVYFMAIDGKISEEEQNKVDEIGVEILGEEYETNREQISENCMKTIQAISSEEDPYDILQETIDKELSNINDCEGMSSRLLVWDLLAVAHADNDYSENENRIIQHVARLLEIDKSVIAEMKQLMATFTKVQQERELLEESMEPYKMVRPRVVELEHRMKVLMQASKEIILDENFYQYDKNEEKVTKTGIGFVGAQASKGFSNLLGGANKLFGKKEKTASDKKESEQAEKKGE